MVKQKPKSPRR